MYRRWKALVVRYRVVGKQVHDARIVAVMAAYRVTRVVTFNAADFQRYDGVRALTPHDVVTAGRV